MGKSLGSVALVKTGKTQEDIARICECSIASVHYWMAGTKRPRAGARAKLFTLLGIAADSWDAEPSRKVKHAKGAPSKPPERAAVAPAGDTAAMVKDLERHVRNGLARLDEPDAEGVALTQLESAKVMASISTTLERLSKITGEHEITQRKIMRMPFFQRIRDVHASALKTYPDAARALAKALEALDAEVSS